MAAEALGGQRAPAPIGGSRAACSRVTRAGVGPSETAHDTHDEVWLAVQAQARQSAEQEPLLSSFLHASVVSHSSLASALAFVLANLLADDTLHATQLIDLFHRTLHESPELVEHARHDIRAMHSRNPACSSFAHCLLYFKGFHAIETHRIAHEMWTRGQCFLAFALQSRMSQAFGVDIHPGARLGSGILLDHGNGVVVGETAVVGNRVSILHGVTLGGTGKEDGDRHPKVGDDVLIGAHAIVLGNISIGTGAKIAAGSLVLKDVTEHCIAAGTPAKSVGHMHERQPSLSMSHALESSDDGTPTLDFEEELDESNSNRQTLSSMNGNDNAAAQNGNKASDVHYPTDHDDAVMNNEEWWVDDRPHSAYMI